MLRNHLPDFVLKVDAFADLLDAEQPEIDQMRERICEILNSSRIERATIRGIEQWEDLLGFGHKPEWELERRKERVRTRMLPKSPMTAKMLKELIEASGGVECELEIDAQKHLCTVVFVGEYGVPRYLPDIMSEVEQVRPYHVKVVYRFTYTLMSQYVDYRLTALQEYSLTQLAEGVALSNEE